MSSRSAPRSSPGSACGAPARPGRLSAAIPPHPDHPSRWRVPSRFSRAPFAEGSKTADGHDISCVQGRRMHPADAQACLRSRGMSPTNTTVSPLPAVRPDCFSRARRRSRWDTAGRRPRTPPRRLRPLREPETCRHRHCRRREPSDRSKLATIFPDSCFLNFPSPLPPSTR